MTDEQRQKIKAMRLQGISYKRIADAFGLTRDSVQKEWFRWILR